MSIVAALSRRGSLTISWEEQTNNDARQPSSTPQRRPCTAYFLGETGKRNRDLNCKVGMNRPWKWQWCLWPPGRLMKQF